MLKKHPVVILVLILLMSALACNFPTRENIAAPTPEGPEATFTALAQTLEVILTETAAAIPPVLTDTPSPTTPSYKCSRDGDLPAGDHKHTGAPNATAMRSGQFCFRCEHTG
jgi:hypothetical protein